MWVFMDVGISVGTYLSANLGRHSLSSIFNYYYERSVVFGILIIKINKSKRFNEKISIEC